MGKEKIYKCCICHEVQQEKPIRLAKQKYEFDSYGRYFTKKLYDFCPKCYSKFNRWVKKHEEEINENKT